MIDREMSIATQIQRIQNLVSELRSNIQAKGVTLANDADLETCVDAVNEISGGGDTPSGYAAEYFTIENTGNYNVSLAMRKRNSQNNSGTNYNTTFSYSIDYSFDKQTWTTVTLNTGYNVVSSICTIPIGSKCYFRSTTTRVVNKYYSSNPYQNFYHFYVNDPGNNIPSISISGNIMSLVYGDNFISPNVAREYEFYKLFYELGYVNIDASNLILNKYVSQHSYDEMFGSCIRLHAAPALPATTLASYCYYRMFYMCQELTTAPSLPATTLADYCYGQMFASCSELTTAPSLPATTLATYCYSSMFSSCIQLTTAPSLPATTLASYCYNSMFNSCTKLTTAPSLPATTLANNCYYMMFYQSGLTTAPALPATTLADYCYGQMFASCSELTTAPSLPATTLVSGCYYMMFLNCSKLTTAPSLPATTLATYCYGQMFRQCYALTTAPSLPATTLANSCYSQMFYQCNMLTTAPVLSATTLVSGCYGYMFYNCSRLNYIKAMFTTTPSTTYTQNWVSGVASSGTFVKNSAATWDVTGTSGIPSGWTVETAAA